MLRGYFDDSGTHTGGGAGPSQIVTVGGLLVEDEQLDRLNDAWRDILRKRGLSYFHLTKFKVAKDPPYSTMSEADKEVLLDQLLRMMCLRATVTFSCVVPIAAYDAALTLEEKNRYGLPYNWAAQMCWTVVRIWSERNGYNDPIPFVVESGTTGEDHLSVAFNKAYANPVLRGLYRLHSITGGDKKCFPALQSADIIANSTYELATHSIAGGRAPTRWMDVISHHMRRSTRHRQIVADSLNEQYRERLMSVVEEIGSQS